MAKNQRRTIASNVTAELVYCDSIGRLDWKKRHGQSGDWWEARIGDTLLRTGDPSVIEIESGGGLDQIDLFVTSWQVTDEWSGVISDTMPVRQYLHVRWTEDGDPETTHKAFLFETGLSFRSFEEADSL